MPIRFFAVASLLAILIPSQATSQDQLRWKFRSNDQLKYSVVQTMESSTTFGDEEVTSTFSQAIDMSWQIMAVAANGDTQLNQVFDRVRLRMIGGPAGTIEFDTNEAASPDNPVIKALSDTFGNIVGQQFQIVMSPTGQIGRVDVPEKLLTAVRQSSAGQQGALDEKMLQDMMKQSAVMLPEGSVSPGSKWTTTQVVQMPFGTMTITSAMSYTQKDANGYAIIDFVPDVKITPREGTPARMNLDGVSGAGRVVFDIAQGRVNKSQLDLTLNMTMEINGQKLPQSVHNVTSMTLVP